MTIHLYNKKILVTRETQAAAKFAELIKEHHGVPIQAPVLKINCVSLDQHIRNKFMSKQYDWVFFTSKNGVDCLMNQNVSIHGIRIAAVGPKTAKAIEDYGYEVTFIPSTYNAETMASEFLEIYKDSGKVLLVRGNIARKVLVEALQKSNQPFDCAEVYETGTNISEQANLQQVLQTEKLDYITFTSPSTIDAFIHLKHDYQVSSNTVIVCIGTTTEQRAIDVGFSNVIVPNDFTIEGMLHLIHEHIEKKGE